MLETAIFRVFFEMRAFKPPFDAGLTGGASAKALPKASLATRIPGK
jgi:hypothetical protein